jgi:large subunit ribosomal protein L1
MGKRLANAKKDIDTTKTYSAEEAIELAKKTATTKFTGNIETHISLGIDPKKSDQIVRAVVKFPHSTGKIKRVVIFKGTEGEELIKKIKETEKLDFDVAVADPAIMPKLASIAKLLGPRGLMPNPKSGTVTTDVEKAAKEFAEGKAEFKNDESGNVHMTLGKSNLETKALVDNFNTFIEALNHAKPGALKKEFINSVTIHATMGPGIQVKL